MGCFPCRSGVIEAAELLLSTGKEVRPGIFSVPAHGRSASEILLHPAKNRNRRSSTTGPNVGVSRSVVDPLRRRPAAVNVMSNGHYNVMVTSTGTGFSRADQVAGDAVER